MLSFHASPFSVKMISEGYVGHAATWAAMRERVIPLSWRIGTNSSSSNRRTPVRGDEDDDEDEDDDDGDGDDDDDDGDGFSGV